VVPASYLARSDETEQVWLERLDAVGTTPVLREPFDGDPNTHDPGEAVETMTDGWLVISYPNPIAKLPVWHTSTREQMYIVPDADVPPGYTDVEPPDSAYPIWDDDAGEWSIDFARIWQAKQSEIRDNAQVFLDDIAQREYPQWEVETWTDQEAEALAYQADSAAITPTLDGISAGRGMDKATLVQNVINNAMAWRPLAAYVVGQRLKLKDELDAATTPEQVVAIDVTYVLPA
ncbi:MAG: hypothetical protein JEY79_11060, partial [Pseudodesulfovibrio sp.]|nr:hypothetical protein [Pseudodesulfovibrio sp.]